MAASGVLYPVMATLTASGAIGTMAAAVGIWRSVKRHERALFGDESVDQWDGVVPTVERNERRSIENRDVLDEEGIR